MSCSDIKFRDEQDALGPKSLRSIIKKLVFELINNHYLIMSIIGKNKRPRERSLGYSDLKFRFEQDALGLKSLRLSDKKLVFDQLVPN